MVLDKMGQSTITPNKPSSGVRGPEGEPLTFRELLSDVRKMWGSKVAYQQKVRRDWQRVTNEQVYEQSYRVAAGLKTLGLHQGDRVAIVAENSIDWVCAYNGIVLAGGIAVPIYYDLQPLEVAEALTRSGARFSFLGEKPHRRLSSALASLETVILFGNDPVGGSVPTDLRRSEPELISYADLGAGANEASRASVAATHIQPDDLASIVFTSGTSGGMKGVMLTHRNFMANLQQVRKSIPLNDKDRIAMVLPLHHAFPFTMSMVVAPYIGGEITFENDLRRIRDRMAEVKPTIFLGVPQLFEVMWRNIVHSIEVQGRMDTFKKGMRIAEATKKRTGINIGRIVFRELHAKLGGSLRFAVNGAAALNPQVGLNFARIGLPIIQGWGLSEAAPCLAAQRWSPRKFYTTNYYEERLGTVGSALEGVELALIDVPEKELYVHLHGEGELIARGDNIMPGYWQAEEATEAAKVGEWLRTGDVGRIDAEGNVWITGRSKFVIVLDSGEKIHPDEVEEKLERSSVVEDAAVIGRKARGKTQAWAIVYPNKDEVLALLDGASLTEEVVRTIVRAEIARVEEDIAPYKRPVDFMLTDLPLPRTMPLRKLARGQISDNYTFDPDRWSEGWDDHLAAIATPGGDSDTDDAEGTTA
jgi:long-chain acyl-CoA synthetase